MESRKKVVEMLTLEELRSEVHRLRQENEDIVRDAAHVCDVYAGHLLAAAETGVHGVKMVGEAKERLLAASSAARLCSHSILNMKRS